MSSGPATTDPPKEASTFQQLVAARGRFSTLEPSPGLVWTTKSGADGEHLTFKTGRRRRVRPPALRPFYAREWADVEVVRDPASQRWVVRPRGMALGARTGGGDRSDTDSDSASSSSSSSSSGRLWPIESDDGTAEIQGEPDVHRERLHALSMEYSRLSGIIQKDLLTDLTAGKWYHLGVVVAMREIFLEMLDAVARADSDAENEAFAKNLLDGVAEDIDVVFRYYGIMFNPERTPNLDMIPNSDDRWQPITGFVDRLWDRVMRATLRPDEFVERRNLRDYKLGAAEEALGIGARAPRAQRRRAAAANRLKQTARRVLESRRRPTTRRLGAAIVAFYLGQQIARRVELGAPFSASIDTRIAAIMHELHVLTLVDLEPHMAALAVDLA